MFILRRLRPFAGSSAAIPALVIALVMDVLLLAAQPAGSRGAVGDWIVDAQRSRRCRCGGGDDSRHSLRFNLFKGANGSVVIHDNAGWDAAKGAIDHVIVLVDRDDEGFYAPTTYSRWAKVIGPSTEELLPRQRDIRRQIIDRSFATLGVMSIGAGRQALIEGKVAHLDGISLFGWAHNAVSIGLFAMLCWSLSIQTPRAIAAMRDSMHTCSPDECPHCRYSTIGLTTNTCPECGHTLPLP